MGSRRPWWLNQAMRLAVIRRRSDDETQLKATALGIQTTSKLSTSEYRAVILRTPAMSKDKERLRRYSVEWSFGPKQLDNLDRLVAAMVKKHINFSDIVQVAVGLRHP